MGGLEQKDIFYAQGFLEKWLEDEGAPRPVLEQLQSLAKGVQFYKEKYEREHEDLLSLRDLYNSLTAASANYLQVIQVQKETIDQQLMDSQREFHDENRLDRG